MNELQRITFDKLLSDYAAAAVQVKQVDWWDAPEAVQIADKSKLKLTQYVESLATGTAS